ncbi:MAG: hypothetical protein KDK97_17825 [Verrucomicrobiales bacterium]|nr:hypothetical protein [Verrucomicrobiales bacterium]MCP5556236.1 hypothetical protein [Verrucomicrobiaceae bacterium]
MPDSLQTLFSPLNTFVMGFLLGCIFLALALWSHWKTKREFKRYRSHLSDKLELDSRQIQDLNKERARLAQESEHLRLQIARLNERPDNKLQRDLEIMARAEKQMMINAPGFAPAWEMAKSQAVSQIESEEKGMSFPQRIFRKLLGGNGGNGQQTLTENGSSSNAESPAEATASAN